MSMITEQIKMLRDEADYIKDAVENGCNYPSNSGQVKLLREAADTIETLSAKQQAANMERSSAYYHGGWIPVSERLPEMHKEDGLLKKFTKERSDEVLVTIKDNNNGSVVVHSGCELWDGEWHGDIFRWLEASKCDYAVIAWMPLPEAYKESEVDT